MRLIMNRLIALLLTAGAVVACDGDTASDTGTADDSGTATTVGTTETAPPTDSGDTASGSDTQDTDTQDTAPPALSLADLVDHSVNKATAGWSDPAQALILETQKGNNPPGGFNGQGTGSKAIAGLPGLDGLLLGELETLTVDAQVGSGTAHLYVNVQLDLACDGTDVRVLVVDEQTLGDPVATDDGWPRYTLEAAGPHWKAVGGLDDLLPGHLDGTGRPLTAVVDAYPAACLVDFSTHDGGMPKDEVTSAIMLLLGDSSTTDAYRWGVVRVSVNDTVWAPPVP